jgi:hypothetical protein
LDGKIDFSRTPTYLYISKYAIFKLTLGKNRLNDKMTDLEKTITLKKGIGLAICMLIGTGILALPGLALSVGNVHEAILG